MKNSNSCDVSFAEVQRAEAVLRKHFGPAPLIRSYELENALGLSSDRHVWIKDYGWTPVGSFKLMGALYWMHSHLKAIGDRPVVTRSSGNFASGIAFAGQRYGKKVIVVMPDTAPQIKFQRTLSFGAEIRTFELATNHLTGRRDHMVREIIENENGCAAHPYDDPAVICGNGVGGLEIASELKAQGRTLSHCFCAISGGGLMAGHAVALAEEFPSAQLIGVEPSGANDFQISLAKGERTRLDETHSICDGLLSYDVGQHNWPILRSLLSSSVCVEDKATCEAMAWLYQHHGLRCEPSGAIAIAALLSNQISIDGDGDVALVMSGRNVDEPLFQSCLATAGT